MTAPQLTDPYCMCGCPRSKHRGKGGCRDCGQFDCDRFALADSGVEGESTSAALRRVEQERDRFSRSLDIAIEERDQLADRMSVLKHDMGVDLETAQEERDLARAELVSARQELEQLRTTLANTTSAYLATTTETAAAEVVAYDAWQCLTPGGCGARYTRRTATVHHPCGELTPVRVSITHRTEGAPPE